MKKSPEIKQLIKESKKSPALNCLLQATGWVKTKATLPTCAECGRMAPVSVKTGKCIKCEVK